MSYPKTKRITIQDDDDILKHSCTICCESLVLYIDNDRSDLFKLAECGHIFHIKCILTTKKKRCPLCGLGDINNGYSYGLNKWELSQ